MNQGAKQQGIRKIVSAPLSEWRAAFHAAGAGGRNVGAQASPDLQSRNTNFNDCRTRGAASFVRAPLLHSRAAVIQTKASTSRPRQLPRQR
jgi:hypothetical protein